MIAFLVFLWGMCIGSFLNVLIDRLPFGESVVWGRSHCDHCKKTLSWFELLPVLSFLLLGGRCRRCHTRLSWQYPLVEVCTGIGAVFFFTRFYSFPLMLVWIVPVFISFVVIFFSDVKYQIIPDSMVILLGIGSTVHLLIPYRLLIIQYVLSGTAAAGFFFFIWFLTRGRGMGLGDGKLAFALGLLLGFPGILIALYTAFLTGAILGVILILTGQKSLKTKIAFGPFLLAGTLVSLFWGQQILSFWHKFFL